MHVAFCIFKYFPFGGLQRDCLEILRACRERGHEVTLFAMEWVGPRPSGITIEIVPPKGVTNHGRCNLFAKSVLPCIQSGQFDVVIGFNKMPGLDLYYAGDPCYQVRTRQKYRWKGSFYWMTPRFRRYVALEKAVFDPSSRTEIVLLSPQQQASFARQYGTPLDRFHVLPPGICNDRKPISNPEVIRDRVRKELLRPHEEVLLLMVGSQWKTKGFDRAACAVALLPPHLKRTTRLVAVGEACVKRYARMAKGLGIHDQVSFMPPREDVAPYFLGADLLVHPAYTENTGGVILESMLHGLPVLTTDVCGYAEHVRAACAGLVIPSPFRQEHMNRSMLELMQLPERIVLGENARTYTQTMDLYSRPSRVADLIEARAVKNKHALFAT